MTTKRVAATLVFLILIACTDFPKDPRKTLERARGGTLKVGVSENYPWVIREGDVPVGVEPELVRRFAESIDAQVEWIWGSPETHFAGLEQYDLHLAITGVTKTSPWRKHLGFSEPYHTSRVIIAQPPGAGPVESIDGLEVIVPDEGAYAGWVREQDGIPVPTRRIEDPEGLVAIDDWKVESLSLHPTEIVLHEHQHVFAAPPGENGFLMALENAIHDVPIAPLIDEATRHEKRKIVVERPQEDGSR